MKRYWQQPLLYCKIISTIACYDNYPATFVAGLFLFLIMAFLKDAMELRIVTLSLSKGILQIFITDLLVGLRQAQPDNRPIL